MIGLGVWAEERGFLGLKGSLRKTDAPFGVLLPARALVAKACFAVSDFLVAVNQVFSYQTACGLRVGAEERSDPAAATATGKSINTVAEAKAIANAYIKSLEDKGTKNLSHRDLKTLQGYYRTEERKALAAHCAAIQSSGVDPFDDDEPTPTQHLAMFQDLASKLRTINQEHSRRSNERRMEEREEG